MDNLSVIEGHISLTTIEAWYVATTRGREDHLPETYRALHALQYPEVAAITEVLSYARMASLELPDVSDTARWGLQGNLRRLSEALACAPSDRARARAIFQEEYRVFSSRLRTNALGREFALWPAWFWQTVAGKKVYLVAALVYGDGKFFTAIEVQREYGVSVSQIGQMQRCGEIDYLENPWAAHSRRNRRFMTDDMVQDYLHQRVIAN